MPLRLQSLLAAAAISIGFVAMPVSAQAQAPAPAPPPPAEPGPMIEPTEEQLAAFAVAYINVVNIQTAYDPQIRAATDDNQVQQLQEEAENQMLAAVQATGLVIEEYVAILDRAAADEAFAGQLQQLINAEVQAQQGAPDPGAPAPPPAPGP